MNLRATLALGLAFSLSACWNSAAPLMPAKAVDAVPLSGVYASVSSDPAATKTWYRITPKGKALAVEKAQSEGENPDNWLADRTLSFDALGNSVYLVQSVNAAGTERNYVLMRIAEDGDLVSVTTPSCNAQQAAEYGATFAGSMCSFTSYDKVLAAARKVVARTASDPKSVTYSFAEYRRAD